MSSETNQSRSLLIGYCNGVGLDIGFGGDAIHHNAIAFDLEQPYCPSFEGDTQHIRGDCRDLSMFCDDSMDYIYSSHLLEDFYWHELVEIIREWCRVLKPGGFLVLNCPDQQEYLEYCRADGTEPNQAHKEPDFSWVTFQERVLDVDEAFETEMSRDLPPYSWLYVGRKV